MTTISIEEAQANLPEIIGSFPKGEQLMITQGGQVIARLIVEQPENRERLQPGFAKGMLTILSDDDDHLKDFAEYMP